MSGKRSQSSAGPATRGLFACWPATRRTALARALAGAGLLAAAPLRVFSAAVLVIANVTELYPVEVARIGVPTSARDAASMITGWPGQVSIGGGRYSMGGQIAVKDGLHLDMRAMNKLVWIRPRDKTVVAHGPIGATVRALQLVLADGTIVEANAREHAELFRAAIGGYGAVGVITEIELELADNARIERVVTELSLDRYVEHFERVVLNDKASVLHNADLLPPDFDTPVAVTWRKTGKALTEPARLVPRGKSYALEQNVIWLMTELPGGSKLRRSIVHPLLNAKGIVKHLNHEASLDVAELEPRSRRDSTFVLQEYFVPKQHFLPFARQLATLLRRHATGVLNVSIRHASADKVSLLPWARDDVYSFVIYFKQRTNVQAQERVGRWTRELIDLALAHEGRYYLPYQLHATRQQFEQAYPEIEALRRVKRTFDPDSKFSNELWAKVL